MATSSAYSKELIAVADGPEEDENREGPNGRPEGTGSMTGQASGGTTPGTGAGEPKESERGQ